MNLSGSPCFYSSFSYLFSPYMHRLSEMFLTRRFASPDKYTLRFTYSLGFFVRITAIFCAVSALKSFLYLLRILVVHLRPVKRASALTAEVILVSILVMEIFSAPTDWAIRSYSLPVTYW